jgi:hypothetical protein
MSSRPHWVFNVCHNRQLPTRNNATGYTPHLRSVCCYGTLGHELTASYDKLKKMAAFLREQRALFIFHGLGTGLMLIMAFAVTISGTSWPLYLDALLICSLDPKGWYSQKVIETNRQGCKSADSDPHADLGDDFKNGLSGWCRTKKAAAMFMW